jgi:hypothetical protein
MKTFSFLLVKFKLIGTVIAFLALISQQMNLQKIFSSKSESGISCNYFENDLENEEITEDSESVTEYLIPIHFFSSLGFQNFQQFHSRHFQYYYLIKQFTLEVIVPPPKCL